MKQNFKNYIKIGVFLFSITTLITNCQKEKLHEYDTPKNTLVSYKVTSLEKLTELQPAIENVKRITSKTFGLARNFSDFVPLENIDEDKVIQYTDSTGYSTYTFKIIGDENSINFENLHLLETDEGFIGYILSYEPDVDWYNSHLIYQHGDYILEMNDYEGEVTKYSLSREIIWSTINQDNVDSSASRAGQFIIECTVSIQSMCLCDQHEQTDLSSCTCQGLREVENCQSVWSSGGSNSGDGSNGNSTGDGDNNGGSSNNDDEECTTSGTVIIDDEVSNDVGEECTPNESIGILSPVLNDCEKLSNLSNSSSFQLRMQELISNTAGNTEIVYYGKVDNSNGYTSYESSDRYESNPDVVGIDIPNPSSKVDSYIHNHFNNGTGCLSVFSGSDLYSVYQLYINEKINDLKSFTLVVTSPGNNIQSDNDDTVYAITIDNETDFIQFGAFYLSDYLLADAFFANNGINPFISNSLNEERLARLLKEKNIGMKLFRGNKDNLNEWTEIKIRNNNSLIEKPCN